MRLARTAFAGLFILTGVLHFVAPQPYMRIMPSWVPAHGWMVAISGLAEIAGGLGLLIPRWRRAAGVGLIALLIAVFPANIQMLMLGRADSVATWHEALLWLRLPLQLLLIWWAWILSRPGS